MSDYLIISTSTDLVRIAQDRIIYISSDGNYSTLILADGEARLVTYQLGQIEKLIAEQLGSSSGKAFIRIGKQLIINTLALANYLTPKHAPFTCKSKGKEHVYI